MMSCEFGRISDGIVVSEYNAINNWSGNRRRELFTSQFTC